MSTLLTKEQIEDLLDNVVQSPLRKGWKGDSIQFCCPIHGESNPSCGINLSYSPDDSPNTVLTVFHCFSCGEGGTIPWFVFKSLPDKFKNLNEVTKFLKERYGVVFSSSYSYDPSVQIKRYEDFGEEEEKRFELPRTKLAPFKSGKETYQYFFDRGFTKEDMQEYMIGRDLESETVTIPAFWEDGTLAGIIGRYVDSRRPKNQRFKIYEFPKSGLIYPLDKLEVIDGTIIGCESMFDVIMLRKWGYPNAIATMGSGMSKKQADQIANRCRVYIDLSDNDSGGDKFREIARRRLKGRVLHLVPTCYPDEGKDPSEWGEIETNRVIRSASYLNVLGIPRL